MKKQETWLDTLLVCLATFLLLLSILALVSCMKLSPESIGVRQYEVQPDGTIEPTVAIDTMLFYYRGTLDVF